MKLSDTKISELKVKAMEESRDIIREIVLAYHNPNISLSGEPLKVWNELEEWEWLEDFPIEKEKSQAIFRKMVSMKLFRHFRWEAENPRSEKRKLSKWEKVVGRTGK